MLSCKKGDVKNDRNNLGEELKGSVWAGEFRYTTGAYQGLQPFSAVLNNDGTLTWTDIQNTRAGGKWTIEGNKINLKFPDGTINSADVTKDRWSNFNNPSVNGFEIANISRSAFPTLPSLENSLWVGKIVGKSKAYEGKTYDVIMKFLSGSNGIKVSVSGHGSYTTGYSFDAGGIRNVTSFYFVFLNNSTTMKGMDSDFSYDLTKQ